MKRIAIPVDKNSEDAEIFEHFGRAPYYMIVDVNSGEISRIDFIKNPLIEHKPGEIPGLLKRNNVNIIICLGMGPRARFFFSEYSIKVIGGAQGKAIECVRKYLRGELKDRKYSPREKWHR